MTLQILTAEEIADYLKLLGFTIEYHGDGYDSMLIYVSCEYSNVIARIWNADPSVGLYIYGDGTMLLNALSKSYVVTPSMGVSRYFYDITNSISRRSS